MTVRVGRGVIEYKYAGVEMSPEGDPEYMYEPCEEINWYTIDDFREFEKATLEAIKVIR